MGVRSRADGTTDVRGRAAAAVNETATSSRHSQRSGPGRVVKERWEALKKSMEKTIAAGPGKNLDTILVQEITIAITTANILRNSVDAAWVAICPRGAAPKDTASPWMNFVPPSSVMGANQHNSRLRATTYIKPSGPGSGSSPHCPVGVGSSWSSPPVSQAQVLGAQARPSGGWCGQPRLPYGADPFSQDLPLRFPGLRPDVRRGRRPFSPFPWP
ncbi:hypothetical protein GGR53DRAFT_385160 [Hypoxylon sp. FL1150]|nr:hypothetical protein GGR53DRAFT_385160 [Hypoxylon sp. FL1150]